MLPVMLAVKICPSPRKLTTSTIPEVNVRRIRRSSRRRTSDTGAEGPPSAISRSFPRIVPGRAVPGPAPGGRGKGPQGKTYRTPPLCPAPVGGNDRAARSPRAWGDGIRRRDRRPDGPRAPPRRIRRFSSAGIGSLGSATGVRSGRALRTGSSKAEGGTSSRALSTCTSTPGRRPSWSSHVAYGVTSVRNMWGSTLQLAWRDKVLSGTMLGPTVFTTGPVMDGDPPVWNRGEGRAQHAGGATGRPGPETEGVRCDQGLRSSFSGCLCGHPLGRGRRGPPQSWDMCPMRSVSIRSFIWGRIRSST